MQQNESPLIRALTEYYDGKNILSTRFDCEHREDCRKCGSCNTPLRITPQDANSADNTFTQAKSAFVGKHYENARALGIPRLLFVSSDPGSSTYSSNPEDNFTSDESRTPAGVREREITATARGFGRDVHWRTTHELACQILQGFPRCAKLSDMEATPYFAHTNAAKCCQNREGNGEAHDRLFKHCRKYLPEEINILAPDVIVSMGENAMGSVEYALSVRHGWEDVGCEKEVALSNEQQALWLPIYHPRYAGGFYNHARNKWGNGKGREWEKFAERVRDFISNRDS